MRYRFDPAYPYRHETRGAADAGIRASDAERNEVSERLSRHFTDGRLDQAEFQQRLGRAMGATTRGDLAGLFDDLPRLPDDPAVPQQRPRRFRAVLGMVVLLFVALWVVGITASVLRFSWILVAVALLLFWRHGHRRARASDHESVTKW
jgi:Flp pilus assembly protein TadB